MIQSQEYLLPVDQSEKLAHYEDLVKQMKKDHKHERETMRQQQVEAGYNLLRNISQLAQIALSMVEQFPEASGLSLQISEIIDELGAYAQWMLGKERSSQLFSRGQTLSDLINFAQDHGRNQVHFKALVKKPRQEKKEGKGAESPAQNAEAHRTSGDSSKATIHKSLQKLEQDYKSDSEEDES